MTSFLDSSKSIYRIPSRIVLGIYPWCPVRILPGVPLDILLVNTSEIHPGIFPVDHPWLCFCIPPRVSSWNLSGVHSVNAQKLLLNLSRSSFWNPPEILMGLPSISFVWKLAWNFFRKSYLSSFWQSLPTVSSESSSEITCGNPSVWLFRKLPIQGEYTPCSSRWKLFV